MHAIISKSILVSYSCYSKLPQTEWLETAQIYLTVMDVRSSQLNMLTGLHSSQRLQRRICFLASSIPLEATLIPLLLVSSSIFKASNIIFKFLSLSLTLTLLSPFFFYKKSYDYIELTQIIQDNFPISNPLIQSQLQSSFCHVRLHIQRFQELVSKHLEVLGENHAVYQSILEDTKNPTYYFKNY